MSDDIDALREQVAQQVKALERTQKRLAELEAAAPKPAYVRKPQEAPDHTRKRWSGCIADERPE